jgi:hypothetical protein
MKRIGKEYYSLAPVIAFLAIFVLFVHRAHAQGPNAPVHLATDWSHRHLVFSTPSSLLEGFRWSGSPRYVQQWVRRNAKRRHDGHLWTPDDMNRDWSQSLGTAGATVGAGQYPAKYSFDATTDSCTNDFVVFNTSLPGAAGPSGQASVIAFSNLYTGCGGTIPSVLWAYDTGGTASTSVTLSGDGKQVAFVQTEGGVATLVLLKWASSASETVTAPLVLSNTAVGSYRGCTAPCMTTITFKATTTTDPTPTDTYSAPFYDFTPGSDTLYVGDDAGFLHQFTGVFAGATPAETTSTWPIQAASAQLSSPVYDSGTGNVFVATSYATTNNGARLHAVCATSACAGINNGSVTTAIGTVTASDVLGPTQTSSAACHGSGSTAGSSGDGSNLRLDSPTVDSVAGKLYVFLGNDGNGSSAVIQFSTTVSSTQFSSHSCGVEATIGTASTTGVPVFAGDFDNVYFNSTGSSPSGNIYVCGNTSADATLYQLRITANAMAASGTAVLAVSTGNTTCSPVTEVDSSSTDWMFLSVQSLGSTAAAVNCPSNAGCLMSFSVPTTLGGTLPTKTTATIAAAGGSSGIVIDNTVAPGTLHTSQIYYSTLSGASAVQASQALLQ